jgi:hypothetical protein
VGVETARGEFCQIAPMCGASGVKRRKSSANFAKINGVLERHFEGHRPPMTLEKIFWILNRIAFKLRRYLSKERRIEPAINPIERSVAQ